MQGRIVICFQDEDEGCSWERDSDAEEEGGERVSFDSTSGSG